MRTDRRPGISSRAGVGGGRSESASSRLAHCIADLRLAHLHHVDLRRDLHRRVLGDVLFHLRASQVQGAPGGALPREHGGRDHLDRHSVSHSAIHGLPCHQDHSRHEGRFGARHDDQGDRLSMEVEL